MKYIVAGNHKQFEAFRFSQMLERTECTDCGVGNLRGLRFNPAVDEVLLVGTWIERPDIHEIMDILEELQTKGKEERVPPRHETRNPW